MSETMKDLIGVDTVESFEDLLKIRDFCFSLIPWTAKPYDMNFREDLVSLSKRFRSKELGGWCGLNATFFQRVLWAAYGFEKSECVPFDYGVKSFTHITLIVKFKNKEYVIDPYFCRHYTYKNGIPIELKDLIYLIFNKDFEAIHETYGVGVKNVYEEYSNDFFECTPQKFFGVVKDSWLKLYGYESFMQEIFKATDPKLLMLIRKVDRS